MKVKTVDIVPEVEKVLRNAKIEGDCLALQGQLDRKLYEQTMKVLELIGFKWNRGKKCHVGTPGSADKLRDALNAGTCVDEKQTYQFFETPDSVAERMVAMVDLRDGNSVLEPSAGMGAIVRAVLRDGHKGTIEACELNPKMANALLGIGGIEVACGDFLEYAKKHDRILMNPPFTGGQDVAHVRHAYDLLNPGGVLVAITAPGWTFNEGRKMKEFRDWYAGLIDEGLAWAPEELPEGTFKTSGTGIKTLLLKVWKPLAG